MLRNSNRFSLQYTRLIRSLVIIILFGHVNVFASLCNTLYSLVLPKVGQSYFFKTSHVPQTLNYKISFFERPDSTSSFGYLEYSISNTTLNIGGIYLDSRFQRQGIQTEIYQRILINHPEIEKITTFTFVDSNYSAFFEAVLKNLVSNDRVDAQTLNNFRKTFEQSRGHEDIEELMKFYADCCSQIVDVLPLKDKEELVTQAIYQTPFWKTRKKLGFGKICPPTFDWEASAIQIYVSNVTVCRD